MSDVKETLRKGSSLEQREWIRANDPFDVNFQEDFYKRFQGSTYNSFSNAFSAVHGRTYQEWKYQNLSQETAKGIIYAKI